MTIGKRILGIVAVAAAIAVIWAFLDFVIVTFIITFVFHHLHKYALKGLSKTPLRVIPQPLVLLLVYAGVIALLVFLVAENVSIIIEQLSGVADLYSDFDFQEIIARVDPMLISYISQIDINTIIWKAGEFIASGLANLGAAFINALMGFIISFLLLLEKEKIYRISEAIKSSRLDFVYHYVLMFFGGFCRAFARVMKAQVLIALCNSAIFSVYLIIAGFPYIIVLSIMIFLFSLIPVVGVVLSAIPLLIIALSIGGPLKALEVIIATVIIQAVEAYTLEPKILGKGTSLPTSVVILVLIISQHYLGAWGMLIGMPFFFFAMNVAGIDYQKDGERRQEIVYTKR